MALKVLFLRINRNVMCTLEHAIAIAVKAHAGQLDKGGEPYILHPLRIMLAMKTNEERIVAILHDVVEDSEVTFEKLLAEGFSQELVDAIRSVTRREGEEYENFILRAAANPIGRSVKLADLHDNCNIGRIICPTVSDLQRLEKYKKAIATIEFNAIAN